MTNQLRIAELFAGIGGFSHGLAGKTVFASEINENLHDVFEKSHGIRPVGDITQVEAKDIPDHDILTAGFPCQPFSLAGERRGLEDERGQMIHHVFRILKEKRPEYILLENVRNLVNFDGGSVFGWILSELDDLGYKLNFRVMSPHEYANVPQIRQRVFIAGCLSRRPELPRPMYSCRSFTTMTENIANPDPIKDTQENAIRAWQEVQDRFGLDRQNDCENYPDVDFSGIARYHKRLTFGKTTERVSDCIIQMHRCGIRTRDPALTNTITCDEPLPILGWLNRKMTVTEAAALQGFRPEHLPEKSKQKAVGNAVCVDMIREIGKMMFLK